MGLKAVCPVCCVIHVKEHISFINAVETPFGYIKRYINIDYYFQEKWFAPVFIVGLAAYRTTADCEPLHGAIRSNLKAVDTIGNYSK